MSNPTTAESLGQFQKELNDNKVSTEIQNSLILHAGRCLLESPEGLITHSPHGDAK